jgi:hypothetical protein
VDCKDKRLCERGFCLNVDLVRLKGFYGFLNPYNPKNLPIPIAIGTVQTNSVHQKNYFFLKKHRNIASDQAEEQLSIKYFISGLNPSI